MLHDLDRVVHSSASAPHAHSPELLEGKLVSRSSLRRSGRGRNGSRHVHHCLNDFPFASLLTNTPFLLVRTVVASVTTLPANKANNGVRTVLCKMSQLHAATALYRFMTVRHQMTRDESSGVLDTRSFRSVCSKAALDSPSSCDPLYGNYDYAKN